MVNQIVDVKIYLTWVFELFSKLRYMAGTWIVKKDIRVLVPQFGNIYYANPANIVPETIIFTDSFSLITDIFEKINWTASFFNFSKLKLQKDDTGVSSTGDIQLVDTK